jgi:hypothetical protein
MRENRPYGSEGGEGKTLPDPYHRSAWSRGRSFPRLALPFQAILHHNPCRVGRCVAPAQERARMTAVKWIGAKPTPAE